ncbi:MAG: prephenate dehydrogenase [Candidatus Longimicrobiales bacterium M2_2A_002]
MTGPGSTVGIVGLGLVGGSLARDLAAAGWRVLGADRDPATTRRARAAGIVAGPIDPGAVDLLVLAVPVRAAAGWLRTLADAVAPTAVLTDVGSTKRAVVEAAGTAGLGARFVGSHPLAGDHRSGWAASRTGLFNDAVVWLTPAPETDAGAVAAVESLWRAVGGHPRRITAEDHDRLLARISHLPQVAATALAGTLARAGIEAAQLGPGGRDTTRLAGSDPDMWTDILIENGDEVGPALDALIAGLTRLRRAIHGLDDATLRSLLDEARSWHRGEA